MVIVNDKVNRPHKIKGEDERPKECTYPHGEKREDGQQPGCEVSVSRGSGKTSGQIRTDDTRKEKDKSEKTKAVQSSNRAVRFNPVHPFQSRQDVNAKAKQPRDIA
jgi:hypothetical protein